MGLLELGIHKVNLAQKRASPNTEKVLRLWICGSNFDKRSFDSPTTKDVKKTFKATELPETWWYIRPLY